MSDEQVLSQEDAEVAALFRRMGSWRTDLALQALHEAKAAGESEGRTAERAKIRALVQTTHDEWMKGYHDDSTPFTAGWITALRHVMYTIIDAGGEPHE
jgi:hypothetical protein